MDSIIFNHQVSLEQWRPKHVIDVVLSRPVYKSGQIVEAKIAISQTNQDPYLGQVQVLLYTPHGDLVYSKAHRIRGSRNDEAYTKKFNGFVPDDHERGVSFGDKFTYQLAEHTVFGEWKIVLRTDSGNTSRTFSVVEHKPSSVDVTVLLPPTVSLSAATLSGTVTANFTVDGSPVCGNLTMAAVLMDSKRKVLYRQVWCCVTNSELTLNLYDEKIGYTIQYLLRRIFLYESWQQA